MHCSTACSHEMSLCTELPLILFDCEFGGEVDWVYEADCHEDNIQHLQQTWAQHAIKYVCLFISLALSASQILILLTCYNACFVCCCAMHFAFPIGSINFCVVMKCAIAQCYCCDGTVLLQYSAMVAQCYCYDSTVL